MLYLLSTIAAMLSVAFGDEYSNWAVLIAGSNGYYNYRHQSDISHAYQLLINNGFPEENIITFMYNDIAYSAENPFPGQLFNEPNGVNYYSGVNISYSGNEVNVENFLSVLRGETPIAGRPTLQSTKTDNVFIYYSDHGATGLVAMPVGNPLYADQLLDTLEYMYNHSMYNQLVFYLESCESGSMFDNILPSNLNIFATTAANPHQSSYAWYYNDTLGTYMADEYSIRWMQDSTAHSNTFESLLTQFNDVVSNVTMSNPQKYGDFNFDSESIQDFQGFDDWSPEYDSYNFDIRHLYHPFYDYSLFGANDEKHYEISNYISNSGDGVSSRDVKLWTLYRRLSFTNSIIKEELILKHINEEINQRARVDYYFRDLVSVMLDSSDYLIIQAFIESNSSNIDFSCLRGTYTLYNDLCQPFNDYSLKYVSTLNNLCQQFEEGYVLETITESCEFY